MACMGYATYGGGVSKVSLAHVIVRVLVSSSYKGLLAGPSHVPQRLAEDSQAAFSHAASHRNLLIKFEMD